MAPDRRQNTVVLVTGSSGAGHSTAIRALEDMGYEAIDNLPMSLLPRLLSEVGANPFLALGIDTRNRDFSSGGLIELIDGLSQRPDLLLQVLYLEADTDTLLRRFSETRRRHPLAPAENALVGIERERDLLAPVRARADILIDSSSLTPHDLKAELSQWFAPGRARGPAVTIQSFSYKRGLPRGLDTVFDVRFLRNPYWSPPLRALTGEDPDVAAYIREDPGFQPFLDMVTALLRFMLPRQADEGKSYVSLGFGCTGGQHRSVFLAKTLVAPLAEDGWQVSVRHRELERLLKSQ